MADTNAHCIEVCAEVRYWEDADVNGVDDTDGTLIPFRVGNLWKPLIRLADGYVIGWPEGTTASIHYKVCDRGEYWLTDESQERIAKWKGDYVPDEFLCVGDNGYGDYIIFKVGADGKIAGWTLPDIVDKEWVLLPVDNDDLAQVMKAHPTRVTAAGVALLQQEIERLKATPPADAALAELADALDEIARQTVGSPYVHYLLPEGQREAIHAASAALRAAQKDFCPVCEKECPADEFTHVATRHNPCGTVTREWHDDVEQKCVACGRADFPAGMIAGWSAARLSATEIEVFTPSGEGATGVMLGSEHEPQHQLYMIGEAILSSPAAANVSHVKVEGTHKNLQGFDEFMLALKTGGELWPNAWGQDVAFIAGTIHHMRESILQGSERRLDKPARVGAGTFQKGIKWKTVILATQRYYEYVKENQSKPVQPVNILDALLSVRVADLLHLLEFAEIKTPTEGDARLAKQAMLELSAMLADSQSAPPGRVAQAAPEIVAYRINWTDMAPTVTTSGGVYERAKSIGIHCDWLGVVGSINEPSMLAASQSATGGAK